jgi:hypothetical protein
LAGSPWLDFLGARSSRRYQEARVEHAVLLGADDLLSVHEEQHPRAAVRHPHPAHDARLADLGDLRDARLDALLEQIGIRPVAVAVAEQRNDRSSAESDGGAQLHPRKQRSERVGQGSGHHHHCASGVRRQWSPPLAWGADTRIRPRIKAESLAAWTYRLT